jgi:signal transduction histidine kinase
MAYRGHKVGVLNAIGRVSKDSPFSEAERQLITSFATSAAAAVVTAQSVESERLSRSLHAMEEERTRWARELHDETLQGLGGLSMLLASARRGVEDHELGRTLDQALEQVTSEIRNLRALITDLRPASLDEIGLAPALEALIAQRREQSTLQIESRVDLAAERLAPELETTVYRLVQEALTNVAKHADARRARVAVVADERNVTLTITDDGVGFDEGGVEAGFGLTGMRERAKLAGGELKIVSERGRGTSLEASLPLSGSATGQRADVAANP